MKKLLVILISPLALAIINAPAYSNVLVKMSKGYITIPNSSIAKPGDAGVRMHTNYKIFTPSHPQLLAGLPGGETPASLACVYGFTTPVLGCPIATTSALPTGGWGTIALVDAYDNPNAEAELNVFSAQFGLPACTTANGCFSQVYARGNQPPYNSDWAIEEALDIEWAHAMAPNAKIILVEAASSSTNDLNQAEDVASTLVQAGGGGQVSNSWGGDEYPGENTDDRHFQSPGIVYFASSGDSAAPANYPSSSPFVVSAGGTSILRMGGMFTSEEAWSYNPVIGWGGSGGPSLYEPRPQYQNSVMKIVGTQRGTPDISFDANPETGVDVYTTAKGWIIVGGTSVSSPSLAGVVNSANLRLTSTAQELSFIYSQAQKGYHQYWHDILLGNNGFPCLAGYDFATGLGSPLGYQGK